MKSGFENINEYFDNQLYQVSKGLTHEQMDKGAMLLELEKVKEWKSRFGFVFNIYGNDHFIDGNPHFHFDNREKQIATKINLDGEVLESSGKKELDGRMKKELKYFLKKHRRRLIDFWNQKNPELKVL